MTTVSYQIYGKSHKLSIIVLNKACFTAIYCDNYVTCSVLHMLILELMIT